MKKIIPIFFTIDDAFAPFVSVAIKSLLDNANQDYFYNIHIVNNGLSEENKEKILQLETSYSKIMFNNMDERLKVITDKNDYAIYFSRSVIPYPRKENRDIYYKHVGIYGYKREFVIEYSKWDQTPLEVSESLEQLRVLENGYKIKVLETPHKIIGVDTAEELEKVREYIKSNGLSL